MAIYHGGNPFAAAAKYGKRPADYIDFSANINPLGMPVDARRVAEQSLASQVEAYPEPSYTQLRQAAAVAWGLAPEHIIAGNGAGELLDAACRLCRWSEVVALSPCYGEYAGAARRAGLHVRQLPVFVPEALGTITAAGVQNMADERESGAEPSLDQVTRDIPPGALVFVGNPNNPTGNLVRREMLERLACVCVKSQGLLVVDESFIGFCHREADYTALPLVDKGLPVLVVRSLTKLYAMPGLRLGLAVGSEEWIVRLKALLPPWNVNCVAAAAGVAALADRDFLQSTRSRVAQWRTRLVERLHTDGLLNPLPATANFVLARIHNTGVVNLGAVHTQPDNDRWTSTALTEALARQLVLVRDCASFPELRQSYIRLAVRPPAEQDRLIDALTQIRKQVM